MVETKLDWSFQKYLSLSELTLHGFSCKTALSQNSDLGIFNKFSLAYNAARKSMFELCVFTI